jgi:hypothetical protein
MIVPANTMWSIYLCSKSMTLESVQSIEFTCKINCFYVASDAVNMLCPLTDCETILVIETNDL